MFAKSLGDLKTGLGNAESWLIEGRIIEDDLLYERTTKLNRRSQCISPGLILIGLIKSTIMIAVGQFCKQQLYITNIKMVNIGYFTVLHEQSSVWLFSILSITYIAFEDLRMFWGTVLHSIGKMGTICYSYKCWTTKSYLHV